MKSLFQSSVYGMFSNSNLPALFKKKGLDLKLLHDLQVKFDNVSNSTLDIGGLITTSHDDNEFKDETTF